jgi:PAS domain-containing protein
LASAPQPSEAPSPELKGLPTGDTLGLFRRLFDLSLEATLLTRPNGEFLAANPAACAVFGAGEAELCAHFKVWRPPALRRRF